MDIRARNNVTERGGGEQPMLFAHGFGCDQTMWRFLTPAFEDDWRIVLYDLTGAGESDLEAYDFDRYAALDAHAEDINDIVEALDLRDVVLVGHSVSAITAVLAAKRAPERFARLVLLAPSPCFMNDGDYNGGFSRAELEGLVEFMEQNYLGWSAQLAPTIAGRPEDHEASGMLTQSFCRTDPEIAQHFGRVTFLSDRRADMPGLSVPALVVQCESDAIAPVAVGRWMAENMPSATLRVVPTTGHCPHLTDPEVTVAVMKEYLGDGGG